MAAQLSKDLSVGPPDRTELTEGVPISYYYNKQPRSKPSCKCGESKKLGLDDDHNDIDTTLMLHKMRGIDQLGVSNDWL